MTLRRLAISGGIGRGTMTTRPFGAAAAAAGALRRTILYLRSGRRSRGEAHEALLPEVLPMGPAAVTSHPAQCSLRLTWDHVVPHASGGRGSPANVVASCGGCNFNKGNCTIEELSLQDPRQRLPHPDGWDGLVGRLGAKFK